MTPEERYLARTLCVPQSADTPSEPQPPCASPDRPGGVDWVAVGCWSVVAVTFVGFWGSLGLAVWSRWFS